MSRHIEAWMDGVRLSEIGAIVIQDVNEQNPDMDIVYTSRPVRGGQNVIKKRRKSLRVTINAKIHELYDLKKRNAIRQAIAKWCSGSILELSNHQDQQLHVICISDPGLGAVRDFNAQLAIELEANTIPYWEEKLANTATGSGSSGSTTLLIPGTAKEVPVDVRFVPSGAVTSLAVAVACGGVTKVITLSGMSVSNSIVFGRDEQDRLTITDGTTGSSLMRYRTTASADDLVVPAGKATISWNASGSGSIYFSAKGRWL